MPASITALIARMQRDQRSLGITFYAGASEAEIMIFEQAKGLKLPDEVHEFYRFCNGFESDEDLFRIIPLHEIIANGRDEYLVAEQDFHFAEYLIYSDMWALTINPQNASEYSIYNKTDEVVTLTNSFAEFLEVFLDDGVFRGLYDWREQVSRAQTRRPSFAKLPINRMEELDKLAETLRENLHLSYDTEAIKFLADFVERTKIDLPAAEQQGLINAIGAFLGNCIILNYGGEWRQAANGSVCVAFNDQNKVYPLDTTAKQVANGLEDSIYSFYTVIPIIFKLTPAVAGNAPGAGPRKPWYKFW